MLNEVFFRVVHSFAVTYRIQFFARPDMTVTIDQAAVVECHFILVKVEGAGRLLQGPDKLATKGTGIHWGVGVARANHDNAFLPDWFRLNAMCSFAAEVRNLNLRMERLWQSR